MSDVNKESGRKPKFPIAQAHDLLPRSKWLRDYYFSGFKRKWNNQFMFFTTGVDWDVMLYEAEFYVAPDILAMVGNKGKGAYYSAESMAKKVDLLDNFWDFSLPERRIVFFEKVILDYVPQEIISENDLLAGGRFATMLSKCLNEKEAKSYWKQAFQNRDMVKKFHYNGFGNTGACSGHIICDLKTVVQKGFKFIYKNIEANYNKLTEKEKQGSKGDQLRAMMQSAEIPRKLANRYAEKCRKLKSSATTQTRAEELEEMAKNLEKVPWEPAKTFWQGVQSIWLTHLLIMAEESYPGPGTSFGRFDQILGDLYKKDVVDEKKITKDFAKEILGSFFFHCHTAYDALMVLGEKHGINSSFGQLITLSGCGPNGEDLTNDFTYTILEVVDEWYPSLEPKPNIRLHRNSPEELLDIVVDMISRSQGAPFLLNFDERSMAGLVLEGVPEDKVWDYACVGCLENTMQGNDRSGTVNCNPNLTKSIELTLWNGKNMPTDDPNKSKKQLGPKTGDAENFQTWEDFWDAWVQQIKFHIKHIVGVYNPLEMLRSDFLPTPFVSTIVKGCTEKALDVRRGGPELRFITIEGVGFGTTVDSLLAIKKFVYDEKKYTIAQIKDAILNDFQGNNELSVMQTFLKNKSPKYGNNSDISDELGKKVMKTWTDECWNYKTPNNFQYRPGMLSWNYWAGPDASLTIATPDGRNFGTFLSNAICPTTGVAGSGPTAVTNSVGTALGGKTEDGKYINYLPNGASHTITFNPSILKDEEHKDKFKSYLRGYIENGGTALQINMINSELLIDAQKHPEDYKELLVRVTGYNAYFATIGRELQDEIISREMHKI